MDLLLFIKRFAVEIDVGINNMVILPEVGSVLYNLYYKLNLGIESTLGKFLILCLNQ